MKRLLPPSSLVVLALIAAAVIVLALTGRDSGSAEPDETAGARSPAAGTNGEGAVDDVDIIDSSECEPVPLRSDCDIDPDECNLIHNITACDDYEVIVLFNESVTQDDLDEAGALLRTYDDDLEFLIQESFPPVGRAVLETDDVDFCPTVTLALESKSYVESAQCAPLLPSDIPGIDPDTPVEQRNDAIE